MQKTQNESTARRTAAPAARPKPFYLNFEVKFGQRAVYILILTLVAPIPKSGELALRTRKYQMGINAYYNELSEFCNVFGFKADKVDGMIMGDWPDWDGEWVPFEQGTSYDAFLLNLKRFSL